MKRNKIRSSPSVKSRLSTELIVKAVLGTGILSVILFYIVTTIQFFKPEISVAANPGDYQTAGTGNWANAATWQKFNGTGWVAAGTAPTSLDGVITIRSGHTVTIAALATVDQVVISSGATVILNNGITLTLMNGALTDLDVSGVFKNSGTVISTGAAIVYKSTGKYQHSFSSSSGTIPAATWNAGSTCEIINVGGASAPSGLNQAFSNFTWNCPAQANDLTMGGQPSSITGDYSILSTGTKKLRLATGNSTLTIGGDFLQSGGNFYLTDTDNGTTTINITGDFSVTGGILSFGAKKNLISNITVNGNWAQSNGTITKDEEGANSTITVNGTWTQSAGTYSEPKKNAVSTFNIYGNYTHSGGTYTTDEDINLSTFNIYANYSHTGGTLNANGSKNANIKVYFKKTGNQIFTASGNTVTGYVDFTVNSGSVLVMANNIMKGRNFTLSSGGGIQLGSAAGITTSGATGNIQVTGTRAYNTAANYTYNGLVSQVTGNGLPATVNNLTINNSSNVTLTATVSVSNVLTLTSGKLITGAANEVRVTNTSAASITGHSSSSYVVGFLKRTVAGTGTYDFPVGTTGFYELSTIALTGATGFTTIVASFTNANPETASFPLTGLQVNGLSIDQMLNYGYWTLTPNTAMTAGTYTVTLKEMGYSPPSGGRSYCVLKRTNTSSPWTSVGTHNNNTQSEIGGVVTAVRSAINSFSDFAIGYGEYLQFKDAVLYSGTAGQPNAIYVFYDVCTNVDAWVQILSLVGGATLDDVDHFTDGYDEAWQPFIAAAPNCTSSVRWRVTFKSGGTAADTILPYIAISAVDVDGASTGDLKEFVAASNIYSYALDPGTYLTVTANSGSYKATSTLANEPLIDTAARKNIYQINYRNVNTFNYETGAISTAGGIKVRENCLYFHPFFTGNVALPVRLLGFTAKPSGKDVEINWSTAAEINNDYFTLERSEDGISFSRLTKIKGSGSTTTLHKYLYTDENPLPGTSYYRLTQTDYNGKSETFRPVSVSLGSKQIVADEFRVFPNPFKESFSVQFKSEQQGEMQLQLLNYSGTELFSQAVTAEEGTNTIRFEPTINIVPGLYILRVSKDNDVLANLKVLCKK
ncbi:MAG TPA: T9SS type A sorting domain-containing protein [Bacteroidia bacterium]|nr:T9SS type A sorting domain-containing protein [Bacteroidia bacterium]